MYPPYRLNHQSVFTDIIVVQRSYEKAYRSSSKIIAEGIFPAKGKALVDLKHPGNTSKNKFFVNFGYVL